MHYNFSSIHLNYAIRLCYLAVSLSLSPIHFNGSGFGFLHFASNFFPSIYSVSYSFLVFSRYFGRHSIFYFSRLVVIQLLVIIDSRQLTWLTHAPYTFPPYPKSNNRNNRRNIYSTTQFGGCCLLFFKYISIIVVFLVALHFPRQPFTIGYRL